MMQGKGSSFLVMFSDTENDLPWLTVYIWIRHTFKHHVLRGHYLFQEVMLFWNAKTRKVSYYKEHNNMLYT